jgi:hypothetical protein
MVIMGSCVKWLIWVLRNSKKKIEKTKLGFGLNKGPLNLRIIWNDVKITCTQKTLAIWNLWNLKVLKNKNLLNKI